LNDEGIEIINFEEVFHKNWLMQIKDFSFIVKS